MAVDERAATALRAGAGIVAGSLVVALAHAIAIPVWVPLPPEGVGLRLAHHLADAAETLGVGALEALVVYGWARFVRVPRIPRLLTFLVAAAVTGPLVVGAVGDQLRQLGAVTADGPAGSAARVFYSLLVALILPAAYLVGYRLKDRPRLRWAAVAIALAAAIGGQVPERDGYFGAHCAVDWGAATFAGAALTSVAGGLVERLRAGRRGRVALASAAVLAFLGLVLPPPNRLRIELFRQPSPVASWVLASTIWRAPQPRAVAVASPWIGDRSKLPPVPPTAPGVLPARPVIALISIDATRAEAVYDPENDALFPTFAALRRRGVVFTRASAAASQTVISLSAVFSGRYASQLQWDFHGRGSNRYTFPRLDPSPRFPALLGEHGVETFHDASIAFLANEYGIAPGFAEGHPLVKPPRHATAREVVTPILRRLSTAGPEPLFVYAHLTEPHEPYDRGRKDGTDYERYLSEIAVADKWLGKIVEALAGFGDRALLIVTADHGEAFGEHEQTTHGRSLYEEVAHVPMIVVSPRVRPRVVEQRVGLIDLGPTVLDLFGLDTPASFMGQSLVPLLQGKDVTLSRPLFAECKLRRSLTTPDGLVVIDDPRTKLVEAFDLTTDPREEHTLDPKDQRVDVALAELRSFVAAETRGGVYHQDGEL